MKVTYNLSPDGWQEGGGRGGEGGVPLLRDLVIQRGLEPGVDPVIVDDDEDDGQLVPGDRLHLQPGEPERGVALHADHLPTNQRRVLCPALHQSQLTLAPGSNLLT